MAGGTDPYTVKLSQNHKGDWAVYKNGQETRFHFNTKGKANTKALTLNIKAHGG